MKTTAYAAKDSNLHLEVIEFDIEEPKDNQVQIKVEYCGICHSDIHLIEEWAHKYPVVPGHEIVGEVVKVGTDVKDFKPGDKVAVGWQSGCCHNCDACRKGLENICSNMKSTCVDDFGGFAEYVNIDDEFTFKLPEGMDPEFVAPLMCGGITVFNPFEYYKVLPSMHVGVIGMGGLGHMAVKFLAEMGCEITVFSSSVDKEAESREFGAHHFVTDVSDPKLNESIDFILSTASANLDWSRYLEILKVEGNLCLVGVPSENLSIDFFPLMMGQRKVSAGSIGNIEGIKRMLMFAKRNNVLPQIEVMPFDQVNEAIQKVKDNKARYRIVLKR
jgi:uncharacterized zinc-type alcohol dehydrogenase-like protein